MKEFLRLNGGFALPILLKEAMGSPRPKIGLKFCAAKLPLGSNPDAKSPLARDEGWSESQKCGGMRA
ncbi:MAG: hypothetical protein N3B10_12740 [Armatimonadetes bacterium]|nr:hypothetical protein [Armatimonadota bacterium]